MKDDSVLGLTVEQMSKAMDAGELSSEEITRAVIARIEATEPDVNAYITTCPDQALEAAKALDQLRAAGYRLGPLHGVPVAVKDIIETKGIRTTAGGKHLEDYVPSQDAAVVERLKRAGAVIIGKTNTHEYANGYTTDNPHYGPTRNPWDLRRTPGGSSGGSGAAVAVGSAPAALGSDTAGSIRVPSAFCGITGLKPTYGRVSRAGVVSLAWSLDHIGPMTQSVRDAALLMNVLAGYDPEDPGSADVPVPDFTERLEWDIRGMRIGVPVNCFFDRIDPEIHDAIKRALAVLEEMGAVVMEVRLPEAELAGPASLAVILAEASAYHATRLRTQPEAFGPDVRLNMEQGTLLPAQQYLKLQRYRQRFLEATRTAMQMVDVLVAPSVPVLPPVIGEYPLGKEKVVVDGQEEFLWDSLARTTGPFNLTGQPTLALPCGFSSSGLPIGMQIVGHAFQETTVLQVGAAYQRATDWHLKRPTFPGG